MTIRTAATTAARAVPEAAVNGGPGDVPADASTSRPVEWREPVAPLRVLTACGWLSPADAQSPRTRIESASSSHVVFKVTAPDGRAAIVKQVPKAAALTGRSLRQELFVYRLARSVPELATALPEPVHIDEARQVLVVTAFDGEAWSVSMPARVRAVEQLAVLMARWHRAMQDTGLWPSPALGILELPDALDVASADRAPSTQRLMASIAADRDLVATLRATRAAWQDRCLIHGDVRRENVLTGRGRDTSVKVIDWELSGSGDPAWDLAGVLTEVTLDGLRQNRDTDLEWSTGQRRVVRQFVRTYRASGGLVGAEAQPFWHHVASCAVARVLHVACEWAEMQQEHADPETSVLDAARDLLRRRSQIAAALVRWAEA